jgi:hypothetical protein
VSISTRRRFTTLSSIWAVLATAIGVLMVPAAASADTSPSQNWSGYAVHAPGLSFRSVSARWRQPKASCTRGEPTYAAFWVGLGGYSESSDALEQIGTEVDCAASGSATIYPWYELVPSASHQIRLTVKAGSLISAAVTVIGDRVTVALSDLTSHKSFTKTLTASPIDVTSAEWITEAPSECLSNTQCHTLTLADFGTARFANTIARTTAGRTGTISSPLWTATEIILSGMGPRFVDYGGDGSSAGTTSKPSALTAGGSAFSVTYSAPTTTSSGSGYPYGHGSGDPPWYGHPVSLGMIHAGR